MEAVFKFIWRKYLGEDKLVKVLGWRAAWVDTKWGERKRVAFCPWKLK